MSLCAFLVLSEKGIISISQTNLRGGVKQSPVRLIAWECHAVPSILSYVQWYQNHLWHRAWLKRVKSIIPRPPSSFGLHTISHFTSHIPSLLSSLSSPFHKKFLLNLSIFFMSHLGSGKTVMWYVTVDVWSSDIWSRTGGNVSRWDQSHVNTKHGVLDWFRPSRGVIALRPVLIYYVIEVSYSLFLSGSFRDLSGCPSGDVSEMFSMWIYPLYL
jgi:hypothetical protein